MTVDKYEFSGGRVDVHRAWTTAEVKSSMERILEDWAQILEDWAQIPEGGLQILEDWAQIVEVWL